MIGDRERQTIDVSGKGSKQGLVRRVFARESKREIGPTMITAIEGNHRPATRMRAGDFDRILDRLGPRRHEHGFLPALPRGAFVEPLSETNCGIIGRDHNAGMTEPLDLFLHRCHDARMGVTGIANGDTGAEIDIALAFHIPHFGVFCALNIDCCQIALAARNRGFLARLPVGIGRDRPCLNCCRTIAHSERPPIFMCLISR